MARSHLSYFVLILLGVAGTFGCSTTDSGSTSTGTSSTGTSTGGAGGAGGANSSSATGTGGMGTGGMGTGGMGTGGMGTGGSVPVDPDADNDGWTVGEGDCCDSPGNCANPELVNPGAFEYLGNGVDDDCDPATLDNVPVADCSPAPLTAPTSSDDLVKAMDLCQFTTENPPKPQKKWGVISTQLLLANGTSNPAPKDLQVGVLATYGTNVTPKKGATMASLSTGTARAPSDPGYVHPQNGKLAGQNGNFNANTQVSVPTAYLAAHGGSVPSPASCPACTGAACTQAFDSVNLKARIRVPTNAKSFSYNLKYYTSEFPEYVCQQYNDFFITLLQSGAANLPADHNIAFDSQNNAISVNNGFFEVCFPPPGAPVGSCPSGTLELIGTGMGGWGTDLTDGGGTEWLVNDAPVVPGETIEIEFVTWDAGDHNVDSLVLLDRFRWSVTPSAVGVHK